LLAIKGAEMPLTLEQIEHEVDNLPQSDVDKLFDYVFQRKTLSEHDRIWGEEAARRLKAYQEGRTTARNGKQVIKELKARFS
jgi:hypothetical protein